MWGHFEAEAEELITENGYTITITIFWDAPLCSLRVASIFRAEEWADYMVSHQML
jgi:hypothetical protein